MSAAPPDLLAILGRIGLSLALGAVVGLERESADKPAGLRTLTLVSVGACLFALLSLQLIDDWQGTANLRLDPIRIIAGLMGGIGFLGAGAIIESGGSVEGMTTAATIWVGGAVGLACGIGAWLPALAGTLAVLLVLRALGRIENRFLDETRDSEQPD